MLSFDEFSDLAYLDEVIVSADGETYELLEERKWVDGRFKKNLGLDKATYGGGLDHAHILGRRGEELVIVNVDGSGSHGTKGRLHDMDADALRARGYNIPPSNIVEWTLIPGAYALLAG